MESERLLHLPELRDRDGRLNRLKFVSAVWVSHSLNHRDQFVLSQGDQREWPHINTDESLHMAQVPPCFKLPVSLLLIPAPAPYWVWSINICFKSAGHPPARCGDPLWVSPAAT